MIGRACAKVTGQRNVAGPYFEIPIAWIAHSSLHTHTVDLRGRFSP